MSKESVIRMERREKRVEPYNFREPKLFSKEIISSLRSTHDMMARNLNRVFSSALRQRVDISLDKIDQISTDALLEQIESPSVIYLITFEGLDGEIILALPTDFCLFMIERQSGGRFSTFPPARALTLIEERIVDRVMQEVIKEIVVSWQPSVTLKIRKSVYENKPENIDLITLDPSIVTNMRVEILGQKARMIVSYQYSLLKEILSDFIINREKSDRKKRLSGEELQGYEKTLMEAPVTLQAVLGSTHLTMQELLQIEEGDVIALDQKMVEPFRIQVNGQTKMEAYPGTMRGRKAVRVLSIREDIDETDLL